MHKHLCKQMMLLAHLFLDMGVTKDLQASQLMSGWKSGFCYYCKPLTTFLENYRQTHNEK